MKKCWFTKKSWFTLKNITYDRENRRLEGTCVAGTYLGEMIVYLPKKVDDTKLCDGTAADGMTVRVLGGPGMTMSLPPQLMGCKKVKVMEQER